LVFVAGLVNDTVIGTPLGLSSFSYILVCIFSAYLRNITIRPNLIKDWFYFLFVITLINSMNYLILFFFFSYELDIMFYVINNLFTFLLYIPISFIFDNYLKAIND
jgi:cell shape-determining protein MreD